MLLQLVLMVNWYICFEILCNVDIIWGFPCWCCTYIRHATNQSWTDTHSYLHYGSSHPQSCKIAIPCSQLPRLCRLCFDYSDFTDKTHELLHFFRAHDYPEHILLEALRKVSLITCTETLSIKSHPIPKRTKLIITCHPNNLTASKSFLSTTTLSLTLTMILNRSSMGNL